MIKQSERRLRELERQRQAAGQGIPAEQRWWCATCSTEAERLACQGEPITWAAAEAAWWRAAEVGNGQSA